MNRINLGKISFPPDDATGQAPHLPRDDNVMAFTHELGGVVTLARWERADCCDSIVANGGICWVLSGIIRKCLILESGQRRIIDVMMPGDFFCLQKDDARPFSFEVSTNETVTARIARREFDSLATLQPSLYRFFHERICQTIFRLEDHILVQGRTTSTQKVGSYLSLLCRRLTEQQGTAVVLPMSRYDIADHVGIAVETVSRAITELRRQGVIQLETPRCLVVRDAGKLADGILSDIA
ncbi:CRP-like cAMP-binding protein [Rhizobium leguminosarum]|uniref:CRP-like cAMP-binding protein n=1 Tax=Rhizobium leguminosarum TaxID=384 RepID=A0A7Z0DTJ8_RHILE|nr:helix-turn-helix domain-containing protein [Rhizobium leguminosarum]MBB5662740.1 CRP-like cAMP-binding protein [Rhizobium leguminosarum]NYJ09120.1 CRP-like cAMP-binding protein [Rhizobium leguminosarum]